MHIGTCRVAGGREKRGGEQYLAESGAMAGMQGPPATMVLGSGTLLAAGVAAAAMAALGARVDSVACETPNSVQLTRGKGDVLDG